MLVYLDNQSSLKGAPNENYARELLELHTLGVDGGYTQNDIAHLARCLTGWTVKEHFWRGEFTFNPDFHDDQPKVVLGVPIQPDGQAEAEGILAHLAAHPGTARFICAKLARRFLSDTPPGSLVEEAAQVFHNGRGDIRLTLRKLLLDGLPYLAPKYKRPSRYILAALRTLNARTDGAGAIQEFLLRLGQPYFAWPTPDGYPDIAEAWQGNLMPRWQFALALATGAIPGTELTPGAAPFETDTSDLSSMCDRACALLLGRPLQAAQRDDLLRTLQENGSSETSLAPILIAGILASPVFQWY
jgi:uncharacterized protein (DUF1800 family)